MVSEGVDIPRLRVGVFATNTTTELFFRQARGPPRALDPRAAHASGRGCTSPTTRACDAWPTGIAEQRRHSLFKRRRADDDDGIDDLEQAAALDEVGDDEQLSLFQAMSAVATGVEGADGPTTTPTSAEELVWEPDDGDESLEIPTAAAAAAGASGVLVGAAVASAPGRDEVQAAQGQRRPRRPPGGGHRASRTARSTASSTGAAGVRKVTEATADQLVRRLAAGEQWVKQL